MDMKEYARQVTEALEAIEAKVDRVPRAALILGSGLGMLAEAVEDPVVIPYAEIPHWKTSTAPGHAGRLVCGTLSGVPVVVMQGRLHCYEGYTPQETTFPIRVFGQWGVKTLLVTNASGGINYEYANGDVALITDHINLTGMNPLRGANNPEWGARFPDMSEPYSRRLVALLEESAQSLGLLTRRGVYIGLAGPSYETPAEIRMARAMGADLVGMSTVHEVIVANHMGMEVCGVSCVANLAAGMRPVKLSEEEVLSEMGRAAARISALVGKFLELLGRAD
ncbi:purine-nucleoside phosphorylase [Pyramidobacter piscolens]|uniref:purine-nucleoside phosphorylase n=1 Tax=Pyramidobacter piscolens TaxID=638849 RepID=UPI0026659D3E|nr:purine-nucleoside phosphorylase [Pyramidobacter piscolens]